MSTSKTIFAFLVSVLPMAVLSSGFSLYEPSTVSTAMGGALIGKAMDASANFNNPATLTDLTNITVTIGFVTEHPRGQVRGRINGAPFSKGDANMDPGMFTLPHFQLAVPLDYGFAFGLGLEPEFGLGTCFDKGGPLAWNAHETTVQSFTLNPNLAYKITEKWSVGAGVRWVYFDFEQYKENMRISREVFPGYWADIGSMGYHLKGDNRGESVGWQIGTKYDVFDNFAVGIVYKSAVDVNVRGKTDARAYEDPYGVIAPTAAARCADADADLTLPQSVTGGFNWDITDAWHLGMALSWTQWSEFDQLVFNVQPEKMPVNLDWHDTWRYSWGLAWDFDEDWTWMVSYIYDMDCTSEHQTSAMLPPAARHIASTGFSWRCWKGLELSLSYSCVFMHGNSMYLIDENHGNDRYELEVCRGFCHAGGFSITYRF